MRSKSFVGRSLRDAGLENRLAADLLFDVADQWADQVDIEE